MSIQLANFWLCDLTKLKPFDCWRNESAMLLNRQKLFHKTSASKANEICFDFHGLSRDESSTARNHTGLAQKQYKKEDTREAKVLAFERRKRKCK